MATGRPRFWAGTKVHCSDRVDGRRIEQRHRADDSGARHSPALVDDDLEHHRAFDLLHERLVGIDRPDLPEEARREVDFAQRHRSGSRAPDHAAHHTPGDAAHHTALDSLFHALRHPRFAAVGTARRLDGEAYAIVYGGCGRHGRPQRRVRDGPRGGNGSRRDARRRDRGSRSPSGRRALRQRRRGGGGGS